MEPHDVARILEESELLLEQPKIPFNQFIAGDFYPGIETEQRSTTIEPSKILLKFPQIARDVYLPTFVTDFTTTDWRKIMAYMRSLQRQGEPIEIEGYGGFVHGGDIFPGTDINIASGNAQMKLDIEGGNAYDTIIATKINEHDLYEIRIMPIPVRPGDVPDENKPPWLGEVERKIEELRKDGAITSISENLPGTWNEYQSIEAELRPDKVLLWSPRDGQGFYVMNSTIELWKPGPTGEPRPSGRKVTYYKFLDMFTRARNKAGKLDPTEPLEAAGFDTSDITESGALRQRLAVRRYLAASNQGTYVQRSMARFPGILEQWVYGEEAREFGEDLERIFGMIIEHEDVDGIAEAINEFPDKIPSETCQHDDIDGFITSAEAHGAGLSSVYVGFHVTCKRCGASWSGGTNASIMSPSEGNEWIEV